MRKWYQDYLRRKAAHRRLMRKLEALTDTTLLDRMLAGE